MHALSSIRSSPLCIAEEGRKKTRSNEKGRSQHVDLKIGHGQKHAWSVIQSPVTALNLSPSAAAEGGQEEEYVKAGPKSTFYLGDNLDGFNATAFRESLDSEVDFLALPCRA
jgi:hypothetical protein